MPCIAAKFEIFDDSLWPVFEKFPFCGAVETSAILDCARDLAVVGVLVSDGSILSPFRGKADR